jgi:ATP-binding cassette subfamily F protein 3
VANKIWYIEDQQIKSYPGTYDEYEYWQSQKSPDNLPNKPTPPAARPRKNQVNKSNQDQELKKLQLKLSQTEELIQKKESDKVRLEQQLSDPSIYGNPETLQEFSEAFQKNEQELSRLNNVWVDVAGKLDEIGTK